MRTTDQTGLAIILSLIALTLFDTMGLIIKHLSRHLLTGRALSCGEILFGLVPAAIVALWSS